MDRVVAMNLMSELYMLTQGGIELLGVAGSRADAADQPRYEQFRKTSMMLRDQMVEAIRKIGGDPEYVSPEARMAQYTAEKMMESAMVTGGLTPAQVRIVDLEHVITAATQSLNHWKLIAPQPGSGVVAKAAQALGSAVDAVTGKQEEGKEPGAEDLMGQLGPLATEAKAALSQLLSWAQDTWEDKNRALMMNGLEIPAKSPMLFSSPLLPEATFTPAPVREGLLEGAQQPMWTESSLTRLAKKGC